MNGKEIYAVDEYYEYENSGKISVIPSARGKALTAYDLDKKGTAGAMPYIIIADGKIAKKGLELSGMSEQELMKKLGQKGIKKPSEVFIAVLDSAGEFYFQKKGVKGDRA